jgi:hypothetical protein
MKKCELFECRKEFFKEIFGVILAVTIPISCGSGTFFQDYFLSPKLSFRNCESLSNIHNLFKYGFKTQLCPRNDHIFPRRLEQTNTNKQSKEALQSKCVSLYTKPTATATAF